MGMFSYLGRSDADRIVFVSGACSRHPRETTSAAADINRRALSSARLPPNHPIEVPMPRIGLAVVLALGFLAPIVGEAQTSKVYRVGVRKGPGPDDPAIQIISGSFKEAVHGGLRVL
jgi:hypothetical protein